MVKERIPTEHEEQMLFLQWFKRTYPGVRIMHIPNGGKRSIREASKFKALGVSAGVPDLYIPAWALWIEMKRQKGGSVSLEQKDWHKYLISIGHKVLIAKGFADAVEKLHKTT